MVDYDGLVSDAPSRLSYDGLVEFLCAELPYACLDEYRMVSSRPTNVVRFGLGSFEYLFDFYTELESKGVVAWDPTMDSRLVAAFGRSTRMARRREASRLQGWIGPTGRFLGEEWDKGHFIGHAMGGGIDGAEVNLFVQRRRLNRGWSVRGKVYRAMEAYCAQNPGTFCFQRPVYADGTCRPSRCDFGVLKRDCTLWVESFEN